MAEKLRPPVYVRQHITHSSLLKGATTRRACHVTFADEMRRRREPVPMVYPIPYPMDETDCALFTPPPILSNNDPVPMETNTWTQLPLRKTNDMDVLIVEANEMEQEVGTKFGPFIRGNVRWSGGTPFRTWYGPYCATDGEGWPVSRNGWFGRAAAMGPPRDW